MKPARILYADDDPDIKELVGLILKRANMEVVFAKDGIQAVDFWRLHRVDLVILDVMMPVMDGLEACRRIRRVSDVPILILTAKGQEQDAVDGFEAGADDYISKPFRAKEFVARIKSNLNRADRQRDLAERQLAFRNLVLDTKARRVTSGGRLIRVTPLEFQLLQYLMQNAGTVLSKEDLLQNVWGYSQSTEDMNLIEAAIRRLRKKLEMDPSQPEYIQTVWGTGYRLGD